MIVETFPVGLLQCNCTVIGDPVSKEAIVVDPGDDAPRVLAALQKHGLTCRAIRSLHHIDHVGANLAVKERTGAADAPPGGPAALRQPARPGRVVGGMMVSHCAPIGERPSGRRGKAGGLSVEVLHTPGHVVFHSPAERLAFVGDVLFAGSIGRTDFPGGDYDQELH
jgi:glyoxylase-like metal-dependent hydrolase (beta-lactamase superfamily II)